MLLLLKFSATWCPPCAALKPTLLSVLEQFPNIQLNEIDLDNDIEISKQYHIHSVPTLVLLDQNGVELRRRVGNCDSETLKQFLTV